MRDTESFAHMIDPARFAKDRLGLDLDEAQARVVKSGAKRMLLNCTRQWGKSTVTAVMAVHRALYHPESLVVVVSKCGRQSGEFVHKAEAMLKRMGVKARGDGYNRLSLLLPGESRIIGLPGDEANIRGFSAVSLLVIDEAAQVPEDMYAAVQPMLAVSGGDLWMMSTPNGQQGFFWREWMRGRRWTKVEVPATECRRISREFLEEARESLGERKFRQEYLCEFLDVDGALFDAESVERAFTDELKPLELTKW